MPTQNLRSHYTLQGISPCNHQAVLHARNPPRDPIRREWWGTVTWQSVRSVVACVICLNNGRV